MFGCESDWSIVETNCIVVSSIKDPDMTWRTVRRFHMNGIPHA